MRAYGQVAATEQYEALRRQLLAIPDLKLVVFAPLQFFVLADVTGDPMAAQFTCSLLARLAAETEATVLVAHHVRKTAQPPRTPDEARQAICGSTALVDRVRFAIAFRQPGDAEAWKTCKVLGTDLAPGKVVCGAVVKSNDGASRKIWTMVRSDTGLLVDRTMDIARFATDIADLQTLLQERIKAAAAKGRSYTKTGESGLHKRRIELGEALQGVGRNRLEAMADELEASGRIVKALAGGTTVKWPDVPDGPFALGKGKFAPAAGDIMLGRKVSDRGQEGANGR